MAAGRGKGVRGGLLARMLEHADAESGLRFTVKRFRRDEVLGKQGRRSAIVRRVPDNPAYPTIALGPGDEESVQVVAAMVEVLEAR